jgi:hypothetical protein
MAEMTSLLIRFGDLLMTPWEAFIVGGVTVSALTWLVTGIFRRW